MRKIFVSSTFNDMHAERDAIASIAEPILRERAGRHGDSVSFCDLRWGVDTAMLDGDEASRKVLDICLEEIDRAEEPLVVIIGDRYGWMPGARAIESTAATKGLSLDDYDISVTALEIEYGALAESGRRMNTLFYFRELTGDVPESFRESDSRHAERLAELKARIREIAGDRVRSYTLDFADGEICGIESFGEMVAEDISELLVPDWENTELMSDNRQELLLHRRYATERAAYFNAYSGVADEYIKRITEETNSLVVGAKIHSGKTTLIAHLTERLAAEGYEVLPIFSGFTDGCGEQIGGMRMIATELCERLGRDTAEVMRADARSLKRLYDGLAAEYAASELPALVILIDDFEDAEDAFPILPYTLSERLKVVMTVDSYYTSYVPADFALTEYPEMGVGDVREVVVGIMRAGGRELSEEVIGAVNDRLAQPNEHGRLFTTPMHISRLLRRFFMMRREDFDDIGKLGGDMYAITRKQISMIKDGDSDLETLTVELIRAALKSSNEPLVRECFKLIFKYGRLRACDLAALCVENKFVYVDFISFVYLTEDILRMDDRGYFKFTDSYTSDAAKRIFCDSDDDEEINVSAWRLSNTTEEDERRMAEYLEGLAENDEYRMRYILFYYAKLKRYDKIIDYIADVMANHRGTRREEAISQAQLYSDDIAAMLAGVSDGCVTPELLYYISDRVAGELSCYSIAEYAKRRYAEDGNAEWLRAAIDSNIKCGEFVDALEEINSLYSESDGEDKLSLYIRACEGLICATSDHKESEVYRKAMISYLGSLYRITGDGRFDRRQITVELDLADSEVAFRLEESLLTDGDAERLIADYAWLLKRINGAKFDTRVGHFEAARAYFGIGRLELYRSHLKNARCVLHSAKGEIEQVTGLNECEGRLAGDIYYHLGLLYRGYQDIASLDAAVGYFERATEIKERQSDPDTDAKTAALLTRIRKYRGESLDEIHESICELWSSEFSLAYANAVDTVYCWMTRFNAKCITDDNESGRLGKYDIVADSGAANIAVAEAHALRIMAARALGKGRLKLHGYNDLTTVRHPIFFWKKSSKMRYRKSKRYDEELAREALRKVYEAECHGIGRLESYCRGADVAVFLGDGELALGFAEGLIKCITELLSESREVENLLIACRAEMTAVKVYRHFGTHGQVVAHYSEMRKYLGEAKMPRDKTAGFFTAHYANCMNEVAMSVLKKAGLDPKKRNTPPTVGKKELEKAIEFLRSGIKEYETFGTDFAIHTERAKLELTAAWVMSLHGGEEYREIGRASCRERVFPHV